MQRDTNRTHEQKEGKEKYLWILRTKMTQSRTGLDLFEVERTLIEVFSTENTSIKVY